MSEAGFVCIGQVAECFSGYPFESKEFCPPGEGEARVFRGDNLKEGCSEWGAKEKRWKAISPELEKYQLKQNDVLVGMDGSKVGKNWTRVDKGDLPALLGQRVCRIRAGEFADQDFIFHVFGSYDFKSYVECVKTGTSIPHISNNQIRDFGVFLPPLSEQKKIAEILSGIDRAINKLQDQIAKATSLLNAISGDLISGKISHCGHKMSAHGLIPTNWEIKKLDECLDPYDHQSRTDGEHEVLTSSSKGLMRQSEYYGANRITRRDSTGFNIIPNGYLTYRSRSDSNSFYFNRNNLEITGLVSKYYPVFCPKEGTQASAFFSLLLNHYSPLLSRESVGTSQVVLSYNALKRVCLPIPPLSEQLEITKTIASLKNAICKEDQKIISLNELRSSLSSDLLSGRKRVSI